MGRCNGNSRKGRRMVAALSLALEQSGRLTPQRVPRRSQRLPAHLRQTTRIHARSHAVASHRALAMRLMNPQSVWEQHAHLPTLRQLIGPGPPLGFHGATYLNWYILSKYLLSMTTPMFEKYLRRSRMHAGGRGVRAGPRNKVPPRLGSLSRSVAAPKSLPAQYKPSGTA